MERTKCPRCGGDIVFLPGRGGGHVCPGRKAGELGHAADRVEDPEARRQARAIIDALEITALRALGYLPDDPWDRD